MKMSRDREEYFACISRDGRSMETSRYREPYYNQALYERDMLRHVLLREPRPRLADPIYAGHKEETPCSPIA